VPYGAGWAADGSGQELKLLPYAAVWAGHGSGQELKLVPYGAEAPALRRVPCRGEDTHEPRSCDRRNLKCRW
jgi:hypothetical protein